MENCLTTPAGTDQQTGIGKNAFEGRPEDYADFCHALIAEGLMTQGGEPHPWTISPLPEPISPETARSLLHDSQANRIPGAFIRIVLQDELSNSVEYYDVHGNLFAMADKAAELLAHFVLPEQCRRSGGVFLSKLCDPKARDNAALATAVSSAHLAPSHTVTFPRDPVQTLLFYTLAVALCYKNFDCAKPVTVQILPRTMEVSIPCPLPLAPMPRWSSEQLGSVLELRDIPMTCNDMIVSAARNAGIIDAPADLEILLECVEQILRRIGYHFSYFSLEDRCLVARLFCVA